MYGSEEIREAQTTVERMTMARLVNVTADNLREMDEVFNDINVCLLGPDKEIRKDRPKAEGLLDTAAQAAETSALMLERLLKLRALLFG